MTSDSNNDQELKDFIINAMDKIRNDPMWNDTRFNKQILYFNTIANLYAQAVACFNEDLHADIQQQTSATIKLDYDAMRKQLNE